MNSEYINWCPDCKAPQRCTGDSARHCGAKYGYQVPVELANYIAKLQNNTRDIATDYAVENFGVHNKTWAEVVYDKWLKNRNAP